MDRAARNTQRTEEVQRRHERGKVEVEVVEDVLVGKDDAHRHHEVEEHVDDRQGVEAVPQDHHGWLFLAADLIERRARGGVGVSESPLLPLACVPDGGSAGLCAGERMNVR